MMVPGSIPKITLDFFCKPVIFFCITRLLFGAKLYLVIIKVTLCIEQKYQNITQVGYWAVAGGVVILFALPAG